MEGSGRKLDEYQDLCVYKPDQKLIVRVIYGRNKAQSVANSATSEEKKEAFEESLQALKFWPVNSNDMDDEEEKILEKIFQLLEDRELQFISRKYEDLCHPNYEKGGTEDLITVGNLWSDFCGKIIDILGCSTGEGMLDMPGEELFCDSDSIFQTLVK